MKEHRKGMKRPRKVEKYLKDTEERIAQVNIVLFSAEIKENVHSSYVC